MQKHNIKDSIEILTGILLLILTVLLLNPFHFWMPDMMVMCMLALTIASFGMLAAFLIKERAEDERDEMHRSLAGRNAFLIGATIMVIGIVVQGYTHTVDPWLVGAFVAMLFTKLATRFWAGKYR
jgi:cobalamin synthase